MESDQTTTELLEKWFGQKQIPYWCFQIHLTSLIWSFVTI